MRFFLTALAILLVVFISLNTLLIRQSQKLITASQINRNEIAITGNLIVNLIQAKEQLEAFATNKTKLEQALPSQQDAYGVLSQIANQDQVTLSFDNKTAATKPATSTNGQLALSITAKAKSADNLRQFLTHLEHGTQIVTIKKLNYLPTAADPSVSLDIIIYTL